jgi:hypothetical protein
MGHLKAVWRFLKREDGYTFSLQLMFLFVTFGFVMLAMVAWFGSGLLAGKELNRLAKNTALAAQSQVTQVAVGSNAGFVSSSDWALQSNYATAANTVFSQEISDMHLNNAFSNLQCQVKTNGNRITVNVTGSYLPLFLQNVAQRFPQLQAVSVPMKATAPVEYKVVGGKG